MKEINQNIIIATMQKDIEYIKESIDRLTSVVEKHISHCESKYASKWVEKTTTFIIASIAIILIGAILQLVIK